MVNLDGAFGRFAVNYATVHLTFSANGRFEEVWHEDGFDGTYTFGPRDEVVFDFDKEFGGKKRHTRRIIVSGDTMTVHFGDGTHLMFQKITPTATSP